MNDSFLVSGIERFSDLARDEERLFCGERSAREFLRERFPGNQLQNQEVDSVGFFQSIDGSDVRMVERRSAASAKALGSTLMATSRPSLVSVAR